MGELTLHLVLFCQMLIANFCAVICAVGALHFHAKAPVMSQEL